MANKILIKICGVVSATDASMCAQAGADFIGVIFARRSQRLVRAEAAREIAAAAREGGATPVAVFVEQRAAEINEICHQAQIECAQLHGDSARSAYDQLPKLQKIFVLPVASDGSPLAVEMPDPLHKGDFLLCDAARGGSGESFSWEKFSPPHTIPWLLAGGLNADNVAEAISQLRPTGVDVASGTTSPDGRRKDIDRVYRFVEAVHQTNHGK